jgi:hypothetical protein
MDYTLRPAKKLILAGMFDEIISACVDSLLYNEHKAAMNPNTRVYKPRYSPRLRLLLLLLPALFFLLLCITPFSLISLPTGFWILALLLGILTSLIPFLTINEIRFLEKMVIRRYFLPDLSFSVSEVQLVGTRTVQAGGKTVRLGEIINAEELQAAFQRWKATRLLKSSGSPENPKPPLYPQRGYGTYASFWGLVTGVILMLMNPACLAVDPKWLLAGGFLMVYLIYLYIVPRVLLSRL